MTRILFPAGPWTPESVGDYASGTNHVLPTYGYARMYSGVSLDSFQKKMTVQVWGNVRCAICRCVTNHMLTAHRDHDPVLPGYGRRCRPLWEQTSANGCIV